jgi:hypothetical protein
MKPELQPSAAPDWAGVSAQLQIKGGLRQPKTLAARLVSQGANGLPGHLVQPQKPSDTQDHMLEQEELIAKSLRAPRLTGQGQAASRVIFLQASVFSASGTTSRAEALTAGCWPC